MTSETKLIVVLAVAGLLFFKFGQPQQMQPRSSEFDRPSESLVFQVGGIESGLRGNPDAERIAYLFLHSAQLADSAQSYSDLQQATATLTAGLENVGGTNAPAIRDRVESLFLDHVGREGELDSEARSRWREACKAVAWAAKQASGSSERFFQLPPAKLPKLDWSQQSVKPAQFADSISGSYDWKQFTGGALVDKSDPKIPTFSELQKGQRFGAPKKKTSSPSISRTP